MIEAPATELLAPALDTVRALASFVKARTEEGAQRLLERIPAGQHDTTDSRTTPSSGCCGGHC
ncbi:hypothetical protein ACFVQ4_04530 [Streptomyces laurentii]|uniref:hypothetical protein n=1 Tax=Streptomyces laurentii TaxID=39478 RepID=UPI0036CBFD66